MTKPALTLAIVALCACSGRDATTRDSTLARDLALANQAQSAPPQFQDTSPSQSMTSQPRSTARIATPPRTRTVPRQSNSATQASSAPAREIAAGAGFALASQQRICTTTNRPGDRFVATVTSPVTGSNGAVVPAGSSVVLDVASVSPDNSSITFRVGSVEFNGMSYPASAQPTPPPRPHPTTTHVHPNGS